MKKLSLLMAIMPMLFCACSSFNEDNRTQSLITLPDLQANCADETRAYVENNKYLRWHEDDRLTAFYGNTLNRQYKFNGKTGDNSGTFSLVPSGELGTGNAFDCIYALYPYSETATITDEGVISLTLPAIQSYAENSFGRGANTMIAVTENLEDTFLSFKNACGYLKLKLYNADGAIIKSIELKGNNGEKIAGAATATIAFGEASVVTMSEDATTSITLDCGDGVTLGTTAETATEFWVVVPEMTFTKGITITATDVDGGTFVKSASNKVVIERNTIQPMAEVEYKRTKPANNEIWYTSTDGAVVTPYATDVFGANIVSNTYENGQGVITFDGDVTQIGQEAFLSCTMLSSIVIPESVVEMGDRAFKSSGLVSIAIPDSVTILGIAVFANCNNLTEATFGKGVESWGTKVFYQCSALTKVNIPEKVDTIPIGCFYQCSLLTNIVIPDNIITIESFAFDSCANWEGDIVLPQNLKTLGKYAFHGCYGFNSVTLPDDLVDGGEGAFYSCKNLQYFYGKHASEDNRCFVIDGNLKFVSPQVEGEYMLPEGITYMDYFCITYPQKQVVFVIPDSVTDLHDNPILGPKNIIGFKGKFASADNLALIKDNQLYSFVTNGATRYEIPEGITNASYRLFTGISNLEEIVVPTTMTNIPQKFIDNCNNIKSLYVKAVIPPTVATGEYGMMVNINSIPNIYVPTTSVSAYKSTYGWMDYADKIQGYEF